MRTKTLTLTTRYFGRKLNIRMEASKADRLMAKEDPMSEIELDIERISYGLGVGGRYITESQARRIRSYNTDLDYFDKITKEKEN